MGTHSMIGKVLPSGEVAAIYCQYDGYVKDGVGERLVRSYAEEWLVDELLELGALSCLRPQLHPPYNSTHSYANPDRNVTIAYHRDCGEDYEGPVVCKSPRALALYANKHYAGIAYFYFYDNGEWYVRPNGGKLERVLDVLQRSPTLGLCKYNHI